MKKHKKLSILCILIIYTMICTSCWDGVEINRRSVIFSLGIDKNMDVQDGFPPERYVVTYDIPDMNKLSGAESIAENVHSIESVKSATFSTSIEEVQTKLQNTINFGHTKAILLGADLLSDPAMLAEIIDSLERNMLFGRSTPIFAVRGITSEVMEVKNEQHPIIGLYIMNYVNNKERAQGKYREALLGTIIRDFREKDSALIPIIDTIDDRIIEIKGGALMKGYQLQTWFTPEEVRGLLWIEGDVKGTQIPIPVDQSYLSYTVRQQDCKISFYLENDEIHCVLDVTNEGNIGEYYMNARTPLTNVNYIEEIEEKLSEQIKQEIIHLIEMTKQNNTDIAGIGAEIYRQHPKWWDQIKDDWDYLYPRLPIEVHVDTKIRRTGIIE